VRLLHHRFLPLVICRFARVAFIRGIPVIPQVMTYLNVVLFGVEISSRCDIGPGLFLPHTSGTVIGAQAVGRNVTVFQGVTLGAKQLDLGFHPELRPTVGDEVTLGAGCKILGHICVGDGAIVGANSVVTMDVPPQTTVAGIPARPIDAMNRSSKQEESWNNISI
jgi:serine O-acetyltransferase